LSTVLVLRVACQDPLYADPEAMQGLLCLIPKFSVHTSLERLRKLKRLDL
jgi:hypothetical protein